MLGNVGGEGLRSMTMETISRSREDRKGCVGDLRAAGFAHLSRDSSWPLSRDSSWPWHVRRSDRPLLLSVSTWYFCRFRHGLSEQSIQMVLRKLGWTCRRWRGIWVAYEFNV